MLRVKLTFDVKRVAAGAAARPLARVNLPYRQAVYGLGRSRRCSVLSLPPLHGGRPAVAPQRASV